MYIHIHSFISISHCGRSGRDQSPVRRLMWLLERCIQGRFLGVVCHCLPPRLEVPTFATRLLVAELHGREIWPRILPEFPISTEHSGIFYMPQSTTWDRRLYFPSEGRRAEDFFRPKNPTASAGFEPANLGPSRLAIKSLSNFVYTFFLVRLCLSLSLSLFLPGSEPSLAGPAGFDFCRSSSDT